MVWCTSTLHLGSFRRSGQCGIHPLCHHCCTGCMFVVHRARLKQSNINITISNISLERVTFKKFLGVIIDEKLSFTRHISYIKSKISKAMGIIIKVRKHLNKISFVNLYHSFVFPYLTYCIEIWGNASDIHLDTLIKNLKKLFASFQIHLS